MVLFWWFFGTFMIGGYFYTTWRVAGQIAWANGAMKSLKSQSDKSDRYYYRDDDDHTFLVFMAWLGAIFLALPWWITLPGSFLIERKSSDNTNMMIYTPKPYRKMLLEKLIKELERELAS